MNLYQQGFDDGIEGRPINQNLMRVMANQRSYLGGYQHGRQERANKEEQCAQTSHETQTSEVFSHD